MEARIDIEIGVRPADERASAAQRDQAQAAEVEGWSTFDPRPWLDGRMGPAFGPITFEPGPADPAARDAATDDQAALRADIAESARSISDVLAAWRAAERALAGLAIGDPDIDRVHAELVGLRALHHRLFDARLVPESDEQRGLRLRMFASSMFNASPGQVTA
jgi:hypothetical protein